MFQHSPPFHIKSPIFQAVKLVKLVSGFFLGHFLHTRRLTPICGNILYIVRLVKLVKMRPDF